jgi:hypothetical protein
MGPWSRKCASHRRIFGVLSQKHESSDPEGQLTASSRQKTAVEWQSFDASWQKTAPNWRSFDARWQKTAVGKHSFEVAVQTAVTRSRALSRLPRVWQTVTRHNLRRLVGSGIKVSPTGYDSGADEQRSVIRALP